MLSYLFGMEFAAYCHGARGDHVASLREQILVTSAKIVIFTTLPLKQTCFDDTYHFDEFNCDPFWTATVH